MDGRFLYGELPRQVAKLGANATDGRNRSVEPLLGLVIGQGQDSLLGSRAGGDFQRLSRAGQRIPLAVNELLDPQSQFHLAATVEPLTGAAFIGLEVGKLGLPETQNIGLYGADFCDIADTKIEPVGDFRSGCVVLLGGLCGHPVLQTALAPVANALTCYLSSSIGYDRCDGAVQYATPLAIDGDD